MSAGIVAGSDGTVGGAFTIGINIISSSRSVFNASTSDGIIATIANAAVTSSGAVSLKADDNSVIPVGGRRVLGIRHQGERVRGRAVVE